MSKHLAHQRRRIIVEQFATATFPSTPFLKATLKGIFLNLPFSISFYFSTFINAATKSFNCRSFIAELEVRVKKLNRGELFSMCFFILNMNNWFVASVT